MARWLRFEQDGKLEFGTLEDGVIRVFQGDMFAGPSPTGRSVALSDVRLRTPCDPSKMICLWNNFHELAAKLGSAAPDEPLYLLKAPSAFVAHGDTIHRPKSYDGKVVYEGELGIVIGRRCSYVSESRGAGPYFWIYLRQRRDRGRHHQQEPDIRSMDAGQELRHFRRLRAGDCHRPRSCGAACEDDP